MAKILKGSDYKSKLDLKDRVEAEIPTPIRARATMGGVIDKEVLKAEDKAKEVIDLARQDAAQIKADAKEILDQVQEEMERSKKEGYEAGFQEGIENALEMLIRVKELRAQLFSDNEREIIKLVFEIAKKIIGREFSENDKAVMNVIRLAISDAVGDKITVRINPNDYKNIKSKQSELLETLDGSATLQLREDAEVNPGGCVVDTDIGTIDAQIETQLNAIKKALGL
ncbi:MAG: FliH/SctL family protein [bacterium]|nr:FliH/SctL family protein [bacterium]